MVHPLLGEEDSALGRRAALHYLWLVAVSLFLNRARRGDTLTFRRAATPCHAEARRINRVAVDVLTALDF